MSKLPEAYQLVEAMISNKWRTARFMCCANKVEWSLLFEDGTTYQAEKMPSWQAIPQSRGFGYEHFERLGDGDQLVVGVEDAKRASVAGVGAAPKRGRKRATGRTAEVSLFG